MAWQKLAKLPDPPRPWLLGTARRVSANHIRARRNRLGVAVPSAVATARFDGASRTAVVNVFPATPAVDVNAAPEPTGPTAGVRPSTSSTRPRRQTGTHMLRDRVLEFTPVTVRQAADWSSHPRDVNALTKRGCSGHRFAMAHGGVHSSC